MTDATPPSNQRAKDTASNETGAQRYVLRIGHYGDAGLGGEGWVVRMSDHFSDYEITQKWVKAEECERLQKHKDILLALVREGMRVGSSVKAFVEWQQKAEFIIANERSVVETRVQGLKSISFEPRGTQWALIVCFDSIENAQVARPCITNALLKQSFPEKAPGITPCYPNGRVCDIRAETGHCAHVKQEKASSDTRRCRHNMNPATCDTCWALGENGTAKP